MDWNQIRSAPAVEFALVRTWPSRLIKKPLPILTRVFPSSPALG